MMKKTKIGISSYSYSYAVGFQGFEPPSPLDAFGLVDKAAELEVPVLQIGDNCPLDRLDREKLAALRDYAKQRHVLIEAGMRGIQTDNLLRYIQIADILEAPLLRVVVDAKDFQPDFEEIIHLLRPVLPELEKKQLVLGIENHDRFPAGVFAQIAETLDHPNVGIVLDTVNSFACEETTWQVVDALAKYTVNFHVKDFKIQRVENSMGLLVTGTPAGQGFLNIPAIKERLRREARQDFSSVLELWMAPEPTVEATIAKEECWVRESIAYLKEALL